MPIALRRPVFAALAIVVALSLACDRANDSAESVDSVERALTTPMAVTAGEDFSGKGVASRQSFAADQATAPPPLPQAPIRPGQMLIRNGMVSVRVDSLEVAMEAVRQLAASLGGTIGNVSMSSGEYQVRSASMELRVPAERFDDAMGGMKPLGRVEHSSTSVEDVGEEFVDLNARMANSRRLETRLVELLANRTGRLEDVLAVERELARVRQEIERTEGRLRYLGTRVATSTIHVNVSEREPVASQPGRNPIADAFVDAWRNFVGFVAWVISSLGVALPVVLLAWAGFRLLARRRPRSAD